MRNHSANNGQSLRASWIGHHIHTDKKYSQSGNTAAIVADFGFFENTVIKTPMAANSGAKAPTSRATKSPVVVAPIFAPIITIPLAISASYCIYKATTMTVVALEL